MISKILLCGRPNFTDKQTPDHFLCSAFIFFKENVPLTYAYCEIFQKDDDIFIETNGWSITSESFIQSVQLYVRNKMEAIKAGRLLTAKEAIKQKDIILRKQGHVEEIYPEIDSLTEGEMDLMNEDSAEMEAFMHRAAQGMEVIQQKVNLKWRK